MSDLQDAMTGETALALLTAAARSTGSAVRCLGEAFNDAAVAFKDYDEAVIQPMRRRYEAMTPEEKAEWDRMAWPNGRPKEDGHDDERADTHPGG